MQFPSRLKNAKRPADRSVASNPKIRGGWVAAAALAAFFLTPISGHCVRTTLDQVALVVNQDAITQNEVEEAVEATFQAQGRTPENMPRPGSKEYEKVRRDVMDSIENELLMAQAAESMGVTVPDEDVDKEVDQQVETIRSRFKTKKEFQAALAQEGLTEDNLRAENHRKILRQMKAQRALSAKREEMQGDVASNDAIQARYKKKPSDFDRARFSIILFRVAENAQKGYAAEARKQAEDLKKKIEGGADFAGLAKKYSEDPLSQDHGGDMGELTRIEVADLDKALAKAVFTLPVKQMGVVATKNSVILVRVASRTKGTLADSKVLIKRLLQGKQQAGVVDVWVKELRSKAYIQKY